jgi:WD40 repeat protein/tRNA A-37 threonylcarbamoyl transferase component Bud32
VTAPRPDGNPQVLPGRTLGDFVVRERIGQGQYGTVYRAEQPLLEREAVIKVLRTQDRADADLIPRFLREAKLAARLDHPYAAHIYAFGAEPDGLLWIAMELVRGTPLEELLAVQGPVPLERFVPLLERLCEVIHGAHEQGIVHRDIKPANVMVMSRSGRLLPKLLDFGIAKLTQNVPASLDGNANLDVSANVVDPKLTDARARMGSPAYMAPELWVSATSADARSDQYALGVLAYQVLTGTLPFQAASTVALLRQHAQAPMPPLRGFPAGVEAALARALAKKRDDRFPDVLAFAQAVRAAAGLDVDEARLPELDETVRAAWMAEAPQPIAEAIAALEAARSPHQALDVVGKIARVLVRYTGILALACRSASEGSAPGGESEPLKAALQAMRRRSLTDEEWLDVTREIARPFAGRADAFPIPELPTVAEGETGELLLALRSQALPPSSEAARAQLAESLPRLRDVLSRLEFLRAYPLVVPRAGRPPGAGDRWMGLRRSPRPTAVVRGEHPPDRPLLVDAAGVVVARLWPLVQIAPPAPGAAEEVFFLEGSGRHGARLTAMPFGFERDDEQPLDWLRRTFTSVESAHVAHSEERAPYRGLSAFTPDDADVFFGREREATAFVNKLRLSPLVAVVGASGAGKSSFVQAGVIPSLPEGWRALTLRLGSGPLASIRARLAREGILLDERAGADALGDALRRAAGERGQTLVLVIDQFEELFTLCRDESERRTCAGLLLGCARTVEEPVRVVLTLRDDFLMRAQELPGLRERLAFGLELLSVPSASELVRILLEPARRVGYEFAPPTLPQAMVDEVAGQPGALALLSFTAARLWETRDRERHALTESAYRALGGVGGALGQHAEATLSHMSTDEQARVREAFRHLVTAEGTRAVLLRPELLQLVGGGPQAEAMLEQLVTTRLLVSSEGEHGEERVEVIHEALLGAWPRLVGWRREDAEGARLRDQLRAAARQWDERGRSAGLLWRGDAVVDLQRWRARHPGGLTATEEAFAQASLREAARGRRLRRIAVGTAFVALLGGLGVVRTQRTRAEAAAAQARKRLSEQYEDQGRQAFLAGSSERALVYLDEALQLGADSPSRRFLFAQAARAQGAQRAVWSAHTRALRDLRLSPDGKRVLTCSDDQTARIWDLERNVELRALRGHTGGVAMAQWALGGARVATGSFDGTARIWDAATGESLHVLGGLDGGAYALAVSPDGTRLAVGDKKGGVRVFDVATGALQRTLVGHKDRMRELAFSPDGTLLASANDDDTMRVWSLADGRERFRATHKRLVANVAFSPDGALVATSSDDATAQLLRVSDGKLLFTIEGHRDFVRGVRFSHDSSRLVTSGWDDTAKVWDVKTGKLVANLDHATGLVYASDFSPDGTRVLTPGSDGTAKLWDARSGALLSVLEGHRGGVSLVAFAGRGRVLTGGVDGTVRVWDTTLGEPQLDTNTPEPNSARFSPDGKHILIAAADKIGRILDARTGQVVRELRGHTDGITLGVFSPDGRSVATAAYDGTARVWEAATGETRAILKGHTAPVTSVAFSPDGARVATASEDGTARVWDAASGAQRVLFKGHEDNVSGALFSADGTRLITSAWDKTVRVWDATSGAELRKFGGHSTSVQFATFTPDGKRVFSAQDNGTGTFFDAESGAILGTLTGHIGMMEQASFSPDGALVATAGNDRTVRIWDARAYRLLQVHAGATRFYDDAQFSPDGTLLMAASGDGSLQIWPTLKEAWQGGADAGAEARWVRCHVPVRLEDGRIAPASLDGKVCQ